MDEQLAALLDRLDELERDARNFCGEGFWMHTTFASEVAENYPTLSRALRTKSVYGEVAAERIRAHAKHGATSMESMPINDLTRLAILIEEVGEVAKEFNEARHDGRDVDPLALRKELIQTAAMAIAWADALPSPPKEEKPTNDRSLA